MTSRIDYDNIAEVYDAQPHRDKDPDPELIRFVEERGVDAPFSVLDVACGTGNQLIANKRHFPEFDYAGADASQGMLDVAERKEPGILWTHARASELPFDDESFDYASCQFAAHHFDNPDGMLAEVFRVLRPDGRFILSNLCPHEMWESLLYRAFPAALERDLEDFPSPSWLQTGMEERGFENTQILIERTTSETTLGEFQEYVSDRENCSQLTAISDGAYEAGVEWVRMHVDSVGADATVENPVAILRIRADRP